MIIAEGRLSLVWAGPDHTQQLRDLHRCCFPAENWTPQDFRRFAEQPGGNGRKNVVKTLVDEAGMVYGSLLYTMLADAETCRVRRVAVWPDYRRRGLAAFMLNSVCGPLSPVRRRRFVARVRESNLDAQLFFSTGMKFAFDWQAERERDEERGESYYEFTLVKPEVPVASADAD